MEEWAHALALPEAERARWRAAAWLHDALRDAPAKELRPLVPAELRDVPGPLLHGPACAARLRDEGVDDAELLDAIGYHTLGHPDLGRTGRFLYLADFLEPGRSFEPALRAVLRARMPAAADDALRTVVSMRIRHLMESGRRVRPETIGFWNAIAVRP